MARIYYDQCEVQINNTGVLAVSANLNSDITMGPVYTLGKRKPFKKQITTGPSSSTFQISYLINPTGDPAFNTVKEIKNFISAPTNYNGVTIGFAGVTGQKCYLNNYAFKIEPNNVVTAQVSYITYEPVITNTLFQTPRDLANPNNASADSIAHSTKTNLVSGRNIFAKGTASALTGDLYNLSYTFTCNLTPIYTLGQQTPVEVKPIRAQETVNMTENLFTKLVYTGENIPLKIQISGLLDSNSFTIEMPDAFVNNSTIESNLDDIVRATKTIVQYY
jgi:hypothetical protein